MPIEIKTDKHVAIVTLNEGENRFNLEFLEKMNRALDTVENETECTTLVMTAVHDKIFSNGIDLDWVMPVMEKNDMETFKLFVETMMGLFKRILLYPMPTIVAITGHAFAGGAIMSSYFDFRFMRSDRGYFCFPEVDLGIPFLPGMLAAMKKAIAADILEELLLTGRRLNGQECEEYKIVKKACPMDQLMDEVMIFAGQLNKKRSTVAAIKKDLHKGIVHILENDDPPIIATNRFYV